MTDNRTTELREKLNKLIIEIERLDIKLDSPAYDMTLGEYEQEREKLLDEFEQAIAATLKGGTLTADDIRDLIERHSDESGGNGRDFYNGAYVAIADELNTALGSGECENANDVMKSGEIGFRCSECGSWDDDPHPRFCHNCGRGLLRGDAE